MQGLNRTRHVHLVDALLQLENIFMGIENSLATSAMQGVGPLLKVIPTSAELKAKRLELEMSHALYLEMLNALALHIVAYESLFTDIKVGHLGNRLKELKKQVQPQSKVAKKMKESLFFAYGT